MGADLKAATPERRGRWRAVIGQGRPRRVVVSVLATGAALALGAFGVSATTVSEFTDLGTGALVSAVALVPPVLVLVWGRRAKRVAPRVVLSLLLVGALAGVAVIALIGASLHYGVGDEEVPPGIKLVIIGGAVAVGVLYLLAIWRPRGPRS